MPEISSQLKAYRLAQNLTQDDLAEKLGVTRQTIIAIEQSKYSPTLLLAYRAAKLFHCSIEDIFSFNE
jgi:putative transcriptional regulator